MAIQYIGLKQCYELGHQDDVKNVWNYNHLSADDLLIKMTLYQQITIANERHLQKKQDAYMETFLKPITIL